MAILRQDDTREELRRQLIQEAVEYRRKHPVPPQREVLEEMRRLRESLPKDLELPDSTDLLREDRGGWPEDCSEVMPEREPRLCLAELPRREAANCTPDELVETSWTS